MSLSQFRRNTEMSLFAQSVATNSPFQTEILVLQPQDKIFVTGNRIEVVPFHNNVRPQVIKSMTIIGAGKIRHYLLNTLQDVRRKIDLKVLEVNRERAEFLVRNSRLCRPWRRNCQRHSLEESANNP